MNFSDSKAAVKALTKKQPRKDTAATEINKLHKECCAGMRTTLEKAIAAGKLLTAQKKKCGHGSWLSWVKENLEFSEDTAAVYTRCYGNRHLANSASARNLTLAQFAKIMDTPAPAELKAAEPEPRRPAASAAAPEKVLTLVVEPPAQPEPEPELEAAAEPQKPKRTAAEVQAPPSLQRFEITVTAMAASAEQARRLITATLPAGASVIGVRPAE